MSTRPVRGWTDGEVTCAMMPLPGRIAPAPAMARPFRNFLREGSELNGPPVALAKSADGLQFPEARFPIPVSSSIKRTNCYGGAQHSTFAGRLSAARGGNHCGSEEGGTMLLIRMYVTRLP